VYAAGVSGGPTVGEVRPEDRPRRLEVMQIRMCAPSDLDATERFELDLAGKTQLGKPDENAGERGLERPGTG
jgi:hypothetical protein